ncbi:La-type HTH domain [Trinorchestia longiramus]|nr:La-type HTH domain [Trinorchestia longiramus]
MALQDNCQPLALIGSSPPIEVPDKDLLEKFKQTFTKKIEQERASNGITRQESVLSTESFEDDSSSSTRDADKSSSERNQERENGLRHPRSTSVGSDVSEEGGRDSGIEAEKDPDMVIPDQDLIDRIVTQVEIYFSDANVPKDKFLLKHIRRNKEGYVSLKLVSSFKKIKQLTKDWRVVAYALAKASTAIQINDLGTKIRRVNPLPEIDDTPVTCTVLALDLPLEKPSIDTVSQLFSKCGDMDLIRVLRAGAPLAAELKLLASKYPSLNTTNCAWIEFEVPEAAKEACKLSSDEGMKVVPIVPESLKKAEKQTQQKNNPNSRKNSGTSASYNQQKNGNNSRKTSFKNNKNSYFIEHDGQRRPPALQRRKAVSLFNNQRPNIGELDVIVEGRRRPKSKSCVEFSGQGSSSPAAAASWMQRHLFAAAVASAASAAGFPGCGKTSLVQRPSRVSLGTLTVPDGVMRFPKGPDGSKGFGGRRGSQIPGV